MILLVIGGSGSGKSAYAEDRAVKLHREKEGNLIYIATMEPFDEESRRRIRRHREMRRKKQFTTLECYTHLEEAQVKSGDTVLLECLSNLTANEMYSPRGRKEAAGEKILEGILRLSKQVSNLVVVGNNVFEDGICYDKSTMEYIGILAGIQNRTAQICGEVIEVVHGIPLSVSRETADNSGDLGRDPERNGRQGGNPEKTGRQGCEPEENK